MPGGGGCDPACGAGQSCVNGACQDDMMPGGDECDPRCEADEECVNGQCQPKPTCDDGVKNGNELGTDCGGTCPECVESPPCGEDGDPASRCRGGCSLGMGCSRDTCQNPRAIDALVKACQQGCNDRATQESVHNAVCEEGDGGNDCGPINERFRVAFPSLPELCDSNQEQSSGFCGEHGACTTRCSDQICIDQCGLRRTAIGDQP